MNRREFITLLGGAAAAWPLAARAQQGAAQSACLCRTLKTIRSTSSYGGVVPKWELVGGAVGRNVEVDVRLAARATAAVKNTSLCPELPHPQLKRDRYVRLRPEGM